MTTFSGGLPELYGSRRRGVGTSDRLGIVTGINAPNQPISTSGSDDALARIGDLASILGLVEVGGRLVDNIAGTHAFERRQEEQRLQDEQNRFDRWKSTVEHQDRGHAVEVTNTVLPEIDDSIAEGRLSPETGQSVDEFIDSIVSTYVPEDASDAFRDQFRKGIAGPVSRALVGRKDAVDKAQWTDTMTLLASGAAAAENLDDLRGFYTEARKASPDTVPDSQVASMIYLPVLRQAAEAGDPERFTMAEAAIDGQFNAEVEDARATLGRVAMQQEQQREQAARQELAGMMLRNEPNELITERLDAMSKSGLIDNTTALSIRDDIQRQQDNKLRQTQARGIDLLQASIMNNRITTDELQSEVARRIDLDPADPQFIEPNQGQALLNMYAQKQRFDLGYAQVQSALSGDGSVILNESEHGTAFNKAIGPEGAGFIDERGKIAKPLQLASAINRAGFIDSKTSAQLSAALQSQNNDDVIAAGFAYAHIKIGDSRVFSVITHDAPEPVRRMIQTAAARYEAGGFDNIENHQQIVDAIRKAGEGPLEQPGEQKPFIDLIGRKQYEALPENVIKAVQKNTKYANRGGLLYALNPFAGNYAVDPTEPRLPEEILSWYRQGFEDASARGLPKKEAESEAFNHAADLFRYHYDLVKWGDNVVPRRVIDTAGINMPEQFRWSEGYEADARKDLKKAIEEGLLPKDFDADEIVSLAPMLTNTATGPGWMYITDDGPLRDEKGQLVLYTPSDGAMENKARLDNAIKKQKEAINRAAIYGGIEIGTDELGFKDEKAYLPGESFTQYRLRQERLKREKRRK